MSLAYENLMDRMEEHMQKCADQEARDVLLEKWADALEYVAKGGEIPRTVEETILAIELDSEAGRFIDSGLAGEGVYMLRIHPRGKGQVALKINEGMWTGTLKTEG